LDLIGRRWFKPWKAFNPYVLLGVGGDLFRDAYKQPFGDVFHAQLALGSQYVFDSSWALDYALDSHVLAPLNTPYVWLGARLGLSYRYGTQPKVNQIAPPPLQVSGVEELSQDRVDQALGRLRNLESAQAAQQAQLDAIIRYVVKDGDSLYKITGSKDHLSDPNLWPIVYDLNHNEIKDPNLIFPGQEVLIRKVVTADEVKAARKALLERKRAADAKK
jgi:nucleoid-associated protein YgaU